jgi:hypothetical protein
VSETADDDRGLAGWREENGHVDELLYMARNLDMVYKQFEHMALDLQLKANEHPLLVLQGSGVVELRASGVATQSGSRVIDYRATDAAFYPARTHHGRFVSEPGVQRIINSDGTAIITTDRVLYTSPTWNRVWEYAQTVEVFHSDAVGQGWGASYIGVSNRKKTSGFLYRSGFARSVRDRLALALAVADGTLEDLVLALKAEKAELDRS